MSDETKTVLKEAREAFKESRYVDVMKKCKKILKKDQNNYSAMVLLAAAMKEVEEYKSQVPVILQRAIQIQENNPLAWQGLTFYYEKNLESDHDFYNKLILAYCKLLHLGSETKFTYILNRISELCLQLKDVAVLLECIEQLIDLREKLDDDRVKIVNRTLVFILIDNFTRTDKYQDLLETFVHSANNLGFNPTSLQNFYRKYLKILCDKDDLDVLIREAVNIHGQFPQDTVSLEHICYAYCKQSILDQTLTDIDIARFYDSLLKLNKECDIAAVAKALHLKNSGDLVRARETLKDTLTLKPKSLYGWMALSEISGKLYCWEDVEISSKRALEIRENKTKDKLWYKMEFLLIEAMSRSSDRSKWESALHMCEQHLETQPSAELELIRARIKILLNQSYAISDALNALESQRETIVQANILRALYLKQNKQFDEAINVLDSALESSEAWLLLGTIYWEMTEYNYSLMAFLNGIKADRYNWKCLVYLGHYYSKYGNDMERSRRCYQTALQINPNSEEAGIGLSTAYRVLKNQDANIKLLQTLTAQDRGPKWAWLQLGLQYLDQDNAVQAIKAFQHVIRADPNDNHCWESLADAYLVRGAHISALKSYQRVLELCPNSLYPMIQLANIKLIVGQYDEAKKDFESILSTEPGYIPALKGLAETCLALAKVYTNRKLLGRANDYLQQAINSLTAAIKERKDISCIWKLLGDVCYRGATLPEKYSHLNVSSTLIKYKDTESIALLKRQDMFSLATRFYCCALSLSPQSALLWHDLALCYLIQLRHRPANEKNLAGKCLAAVKHAVKLNPSAWSHWNLLGVICMSPCIKNYALAQHAYIMAIDRELNNAVVWSNLGTLYLNIGKWKKANEAYSQAQRAYPAYVNSWVGQAFIAEMISRKEAMDLFRHAMQLGYHDQAAIGYAHWVLNTILHVRGNMEALDVYIIENMHAVMVAADAMTWYIEHHPDDRCARNAYGLLLERQRLHRSAAEQFAAAVCNSNKEANDLVCVNLARVLIRLKKYNEAIKLCQAVTNATYNSQCHLALALFKAEKYEESYSTYETALHSFANTETERAYTLCAMAAIAHTFERVNDAKTLLFQCIQIQPPVIIGLLSAASLGILHGDVNLATLILKELKSYENHPEHGHHVVNLSAYFYLIGNNIKTAIAVLSKAIFMYPGDVKYWIRLLRILLETDMEMFNKCARKTLFLSRSVASENVAHVACALSLSNFMQNYSYTTCVRSVQKLLFTYPGDIESWITFIAAFLSRSRNESSHFNSKWLLKLITITQRNHQPTNEMARWLHSSKTKLELLH
ncbi:tetratricopeptide repeat protein 37 [Ceratina calcarata]|uniref:Tetratricopeptide repeat protein 37 n=1 Tax=Ceratina calcarata TaxID=156304 RepID=A0AAJ7N9C9_9HYME|nr:tetratricopeptide repeat protein 37 [Ceratina calcarata]